jgi:hypothetical protein
MVARGRVSAVLRCKTINPFYKYMIGDNIIVVGIDEARKRGAQTVKRQFFL